MIKEEKYKHLIQCFLSSLEKRFPGAEIISEIRSNFTDGTVLPSETISPAESLLLSCWEEHPDSFSGTVYHPLTSEPVRISGKCSQNILTALKKMLQQTHFETWKDAYFYLWRFWQSECPVDCRQFPADDRLPGSSIFLQQDINSVMELCRMEHSAPAFLMFQIGPVQSFIATARSTKDLLSGSYLIAWLISSAMKSVCDNVCPGCVIFPNVRGQGIYDLQNRSVLEAIKTADGSCWDKVADPVHLINPTLPNRFLALVPANSAAEIARAAEKEILDTWKEISESCFSEMCRLMPEISDFRQRWDGQTRDYFQITWQTLPFPETLPEKKLPENLAHFKTVVESEFHGIFDLPLFGWSIFFHDVSAQLAARRNTRDFKQFITDPQQELTPKDALTGREEIIGTVEGWRRMLQTHNGEMFPFRRNEQPYGSLTIIKRLWLSCWLTRKAQLKDVDFSFPSTQDIAKRSDNGYIAVLALDGDGMGQWINGDKTPEFLKQLAPESRKIFSGLWKKRGWAENDRLPVTPEYHLQFSAALANFANHEVREIVEKIYHGVLIYAGGDDVLALLPASQAVDCAAALRQKFRELINSEGLWLPGPLATLSCGIAVGHCKYPLQALIKEAHWAEHRAKSQYMRNSLAVSIFKRSGEIMEWGASFDSAGLTLLKNFQQSMRLKLVSNRFANALAQLLAPYQLEKNNLPPEIQQIISAEFQHTCKQQSLGCKNTPEELGLDSYANYLQYLLQEGKPADFAALFLIGKFLLRGEKSEKDETKNTREDY